MPGNFCQGEKLHIHNIASQFRGAIAEPVSRTATNRTIG